MMLWQVAGQSYDIMVGGMTWCHGRWQGNDMMSGQGRWHDK